MCRGEMHEVHALLLNVGIIIGESVSAHLPSGYLNEFRFRTFIFICYFGRFLYSLLGSKC